MFNLFMYVFIYDYTYMNTSEVIWVVYLQLSSWYLMYYIVFGLR